MKGYWIVNVTITDAENYPQYLAADAAGIAPDAYRVVEYPRPQTFFEQFGNTLNTQVSKLAYKRLTPIEKLALQQAEYLQEMLGDYGVVQARLPFNIEID